MMQKSFPTEKQGVLELLDDFLGQGGFSQVLMGKYTDSEKRTQYVAVKIIQRGEKIKNEQRERNIWREVLNCPHSVYLIDFAWTYENYYFIMPLYENDLWKFVDLESKYLPPEYIITHQKKDYLKKEVLLNIIAQVLNAVISIQDQQIVHRDLKPMNMLVKKFGPELNNFLISISDFGLSKKQEDASKKTQLSQNVGTLNYQAPELVMKLFSAYSLNKCDAWSVGIILHQLVFQERYLHIDEKNYSQQLIKAKQRLTKRLKQRQIFKIYGDEKLQLALKAFLHLLLEVSPKQRETVRKIARKSEKKYYQYFISFLPQGLPNSYQKGEKLQYFFNSQEIKKVLPLEYYNLSSISQMSNYQSNNESHHSYLSKTEESSQMEQLQQIPKEEKIIPKILTYTSDELSGEEFIEILKAKHMI